MTRLGEPWRPAVGGPGEAAGRFLAASGLSLGDLEAGREVEAFLSEMDRGLAGAPSSLRMIPTFIEVDREVPRGRPAVVIDAGGTNLRAAVVEFGGDGRPRTSAFRQQRMPGTAGEVSAGELFAALAGFVRDLVPRSERLGFCFSYPTEALPDKDGRIIGLWKELKVRGAAGQLVAAGLCAALREAGVGSPPGVVVLNDAVAVLLAGRTATGDRPGSHVGFVLGTGTNCAYVEANERITKRKDLAPGRSQVVNVESGDYDKAPRGPADLRFAAASAEPGRYVLEKCMSGAYLGGLTLEVLRSAADAGLFGPAGAAAIRSASRLETRQLAQFLGAGPTPGGLHEAILAAGGAEDAAMACQLVDGTVERAARLAAISMAAAIRKAAAAHGRPAPAYVTVDGSTFHGLPTFRERVASCLEAVLRQQVGHEIITVEHAALVGAAVAALTN
jgi:hexokinase